jgi:hypothetical protein
MADKVKFMVITLVRNLWNEDHSRGFQWYIAACVTLTASDKLQPLINLRLP